MKRKFIAALLIFASLSFNVYAAESTVEPIDEVRYTDIEDVILERNTTVKINENALDKLRLNYSSLRDAEDDLEDALDEIKDLIKTYRDINFPEKITIPTTGESGTVDPAITTICGNLEAINNYLNELSKANKESLKKNKDSLEEQLESIDRQQEDMSDLIEKTKVQMEMYNNQVIYAAEDLIFGYDSIEKEEKKIDENIEQLENNINMINVQKSLGYVTDVNVDSLNLQLDQLKKSKEALSTQKKNIERQLNLLIGQPYDTPLKIVFYPIISQSRLKTVDFDDDLEKALEDNYDLKILKYEIDSKETALERADDDHGKKSNEYKIAKKDLEDAQLNYEDKKRSEELEFKKLYEALKDAEKAYNLEKSKLEQEKKNMEFAKVKYDLGLISKMDYDKAKSSYELEKIAVDAANTNLFKAYREYQRML